MAVNQQSIAAKTASDFRIEGVFLHRAVDEFRSLPGKEITATPEVGLNHAKDCAQESGLAAAGVPDDRYKLAAAHFDVAQDVRSPVTYQESWRRGAGRRTSSESNTDWL